MEGSISNTDVEYLNDTVWATIKKSEYGVGVFAIRDIKKGTQISEYSTDYLRIPDTFEMSEDEFMQIEKPIRDLILDRNVFIDKIKFISPNAECYLQSFTNHSDNPNVNLNYFATRDIKEGEEILENYKGFNMSELNKQHYKFL